MPTAPARRFADPSGLLFRSPFQWWIHRAKCWVSRAHRMPPFSALTCRCKRPAVRWCFHCRARRPTFPHYPPPIIWVPVAIRSRLSARLRPTLRRRVSFLTTRPCSPTASRSPTAPSAISRARFFRTASAAPRPARSARRSATGVRSTWGCNLI